MLSTTSIIYAQYRLNPHLYLFKTRMTTIIKATLNKSDEQTKINKKREAAHYVLQNTISEQNLHYCIIKDRVVNQNLNIEMF